MTLAQILIGFVGLALGGELLVRGAVAIAQRFGLSPLMIGLTLVGLGTSMPELVTSVQAALVGAPGIAVGNVVGSNICNVLLILGTAALLRPVEAGAAAFRRDGAVLVGASLLCLWVILAGDIGRLAGAAFVLLLVGFVVFTYLSERDAPASHAAEADAIGPMSGGLAGAVPKFLAGLVLTVIGARFLVQGAIDLAQSLGVSDAVIGLTVVAIGTSLPELVTSIVAAVRGHSDVAFGNVIGSNIFNIFGILGVTALIQPIPVPPEIARLDIWIMLAATAALVVVTVTGWRITRSEGGLLLGSYAAYIGFLVANA